ncbi:MAG: hypothetical protein BWY64_00745 [bacterium ADurb.Bin363]|nr:MAG: hypothetical protein BWY64_00745 [bacterium ADurb.Bin363]
MLAGPGIIGSGLVAIEGACSGVKDGANFSVHTGDLVKAFVGSKLGEKAGKVAGFLTTGVTGAVAIPVMAIVKGVDEGAIKFPQKTGVLGEFSTTFASLYGLIKYGIPGGILLGGGVATIIGGVMGGLKGVLEGAKASYNPPSNT